MALSLYRTPQQNVFEEKKRERGKEGERGGRTQREGGKDRRRQEDHSA